MKNTAAIFGALIIVSVLRAAAIKCLSCTDAARPRDCETVQECGVYEKCSIEAVQTTTGYYRYNVGCMDSYKCTILGKKRTVLNATVPQKTDQKDKFGAVPEEQWDQSSTVSVVCTECCNTELCNVRGCGEEGFPTDSGPICYGCEQERYPDTCNKIKLCGRDEACHLSSKINGVDVVYKNDCIQRQLCHQEGFLDTGAYILTGRGLKDAKIKNRLKRAFFCNTCCTGNLCNLNICSSLPHPAITIPPWTHPTAPGGCVDKSSNCAQLDQMQHICSDAGARIYAQTNCQHTCNICSSTSCADKITNCAAYGSSVCTDEAYSSWVIKYCAKSCNKCSGAVMSGNGPMTGGTGAGTGGMTGHLSGCVYKNQVYQQGQSWNDGCDFKCTCTDGTSGQYTCTALCVSWQLPSACTLSPPAPGKCCSTPYCPAGYSIQYPPGYQEN